MLDLQCRAVCSLEPHFNRSPHKSECFAFRTPARARARSRPRQLGRVAKRTRAPNTIVELEIPYTFTTLEWSRCSLLVHPSPFILVQYSMCVVPVCMYPYLNLQYSTMSSSVPEPTPPLTHAHAPGLINYLQYTRTEYVLVSCVWRALAGQDERRERREQRDARLRLGALHRWPRQREVLCARAQTSSNDISDFY